MNLVVSTPEVAYLIQTKRGIFVQYAPNSAVAIDKALSSHTLIESDVLSVKRREDLDQFSPGPIPIHAVLSVLGFVMGCHNCRKDVHPSDDYIIGGERFVFCGAECHRYFSMVQDELEDQVTRFTSTFNEQHPDLRVINTWAVGVGDYVVEFVVPGYDQVAAYNSRTGEFSGHKFLVETVRTFLDHSKRLH